MIDVVTAVLGVGLTALVRLRPQPKANEEGENNCGSALSQLRAGFSYLTGSAFVKWLLRCV